MKIRTMLTIFSFIFAIGFCSQLANATYSIVAVDTTTGAVGSAGGSCGATAVVICDVVKGIGAINTQAYYLPDNQDNAHDLLVAGIEPDSIINWLINNDVEGSPSFRQYVVVTLDGPGNSSAYTGSTIPHYRNHVYGPGYAIAGNNLLSYEIVTAMETAFLGTNGELEDKLMAALQAVNVPGADVACLSDSLPGLSAFIKVMKPDDGSTAYLFKNVMTTPDGFNPIDSLQALVDLWKTEKYADAGASNVSINDQYLDSNCPDSSTITIVPLNYLGLPPGNGVDSIVLTNNGSAMISDVIDNGDGTFNASIYDGDIAYFDTITVNIYGQDYGVEADDKPVVEFYLNGDANSDSQFNILDIVYLINYKYREGPAPVPTDRADANATGTIDILDITYLIAYLYMDGPEPLCP